MLGTLSLVMLSANGCSSLPAEYERPPSYALQDTRDTQLALSVAPSAAAHPGKSGFHLLSSGMDAFVARVGLIDLAQRSLDIQYYIWHGDSTGTILVDRLLHAADRGVRVRLLLDDLDTSGKDRAIALLDAHPNIEIRLYNPFAYRGRRALDFVTDLSRVNRRMHNKSLTADNAVTIVGGRNIGNEYFSAESQAEFSDLDVLSLGPVVRDVSSMFDKYWNSDSVIPARAFSRDLPMSPEASLERARAIFHERVRKLENSPYIAAIRQSGVLARMQYDQLSFYWGEAELIYDDPGKVTAREVTADTHLAPMLSAYIGNATQEIDIVSPYFVPGKRLVEYLGEQVDKGVKVRILTNFLAANDVGLVHAGYMRYRTGLLERGVVLYEYKAVRDHNEEEHSAKKWTGSSHASLHAKTFIWDRRAMFVGSFNLDPRSVSLNTEMGVVFESPKLAAAVMDSFDDNLDRKAYRLQLVTVPADESLSGSEQSGLEWRTIEDGEPVVYTTEPDTGWWQRMAVKILSLFVIESYL